MDNLSFLICIAYMIITADTSPINSINGVIINATVQIKIANTTIPTTSVPPPCPRDFLGHSTSCYHAAHILATWPEAAAYCESFGAELATIEDAQEQAYIEQMLNGLPHDKNQAAFWLGGHDILTEGEWQWVISMDRIIYTNWGDGQPDNSHTSEHCLELSGQRSFKWNDDGCEDHHYFICETGIIKNGGSILGKK
ncbi:Hypothetical predicted protein [Mytilus galloprovincialis]|uniref:C-type lectin domain-containing protein n=1 Tax=Mytilus galloprovincialis TaxID=29158 RepID=A0A8B6DW27_MYTGA|nr:Hypothetical predicted protein [Mytilus galloprovincialis]